MSCSMHSARAGNVYFVRMCLVVDENAVVEADTGIVASRAQNGELVNSSKGSREALL